MTRTLASVVALCFFASLLAAPSFAQSGKIAGRVTDAGSGEPIPGANVIVVETGQGSAADLDGYYTVLNVSPGQITLRVTSIGFAEQRIEGVDVNIGQTSTVNVALREEGLGIETVVVQAVRPVVETDVSNSRLNVSAEEIEGLPVSSVASVVGLQAGIQGLSVRGSGSDEISFQVNGLTLRDERNNAPYSTIPLASVQEVQVQTGGFNAEYGNVRSGVVNVVTKEGDTDRYSADVTIRYSPAAQKNVGELANDPNSYWIRPYIDPEVAMTGTQGWDPITRRQYDEFEGWIALSESTLNQNADPSDDLTPEALQQAFLWQHRKSFEINDPDYDVDLGFGGPVPALSRRLGDLRFYASYRRDQDLYLLPLHTDRYTEQTGHIKVTSNVAQGMKLSMEGRIGGQDGTSASRTGQPGFFRSASGIASEVGGISSFNNSRVFSGDYWGPGEVSYNQLGATFIHSVSANTFYEIRANRFGSLYDTNPGPRRDTTSIVTFGGVGFDEAPFGWQPFNVGGIYSTSTGVDGMRMGVGMSNARDSSRVTVWGLKGDLTSQVNRFAEVKTGLEFVLTDSRANYAQIDSAFTSNNQWSQWDRSPVRGAAYAQTKLEFSGMVANLGLRADLTAPGGEWYEFNRFDPRFAGIPTANGDPRAALDTLLTTAAVAPQVTFSPRLGVSFPVTSVSKLFFNYGHFRALPDPDDLYLVRVSTTGQLRRIADPSTPLPKTVAYELGYEQSFFGQFLARAAGYYKNVSLQPRLVTYVSRSGQVDYSVSEPNSYEDIRGFELTFARNRGRWIQGFVNYTYSVFSAGSFGFPTIYENSSTQRQEEQDDIARRSLESVAIPQPYARINIDLLTPDDFGPSLSGLRPLGDWRVSFIGRWQEAGQSTWDGQSTQASVSLSRNVDRRDFWQIDLRFARSFAVAGRKVSFFADVFNLTNRQTVSGYGYQNTSDINDYYRSLHFPASEDYDNVPGSDAVGDYRHPDAEFQPICSVGSLAGYSTCVYNDGVPNEDVIYYDRSTEAYSVYRDGAWVPVDQNRLDEVLDSKAYIDMPNQGFLNLLSPRDFFFGLRISL